MAELAGGNDGVLTAAQTHDLIGNCGTLSASAERRRIARMYFAW